MPLFQSRIPTPLSRSNIMCVLHSPLRDPSTIGLGFLAKDINPRNSVGGDFISASQRESHELGSWSLSPLAPSLPTPPTTGKRERRKKERKNKSSHFSHPWTNRGHAGTRDPHLLTTGTGLVEDGSYFCGDGGGPCWGVPYGNQTGQNSLFVGETRSVRSTPGITLLLSWGLRGCVTTVAIHSSTCTFP